MLGEKYSTLLRSCKTDEVLLIDNYKVPMTMAVHYKIHKIGHLY